MTVWVEESGVRFGPFDDMSIYQIERSDAVCNLGDCIKKTEFILLMETDAAIRKIVFLEAKSSIPRDTDAFFQEIRYKMVHSLTVWLLAAMGKHIDIADELPVAFKDPTLVNEHINLVLVIPTIPDHHLSVTTDKFRAAMMGDLRAWGITPEHVRVLNHARATAFGLIAA